MANILATQLRAGMIIVYEGELCRVVSVEHQTPGNLPARVVTKMKRLKDGINRENRFGSSDKIERANLQQQIMEYLYEDGDNLVLMNNESYEQMEISKEAIGDDIVFLQPNMQVEVEFHEGTPLSVALPDNVVLEILETEPVMKNANATGSYKPAKMENGITVGVPPYIESGERIRVKISDRSYIERVK
jgi:elongation factor P